MCHGYLLGQRIIQVSWICVAHKVPSIRDCGDLRGVWRKRTDLSSLIMISGGKTGKRLGYGLEIGTNLTYSTLLFPPRMKRWWAFDWWNSSIRSGNGAALIILASYDQINTLVARTCKLQLPKPLAFSVREKLFRSAHRIYHKFLFSTDVSEHARLNYWYLKSSEHRSKFCLLRIWHVAQGANLQALYSFQRLIALLPWMLSIPTVCLITPKRFLAGPTVKTIDLYDEVPRLLPFDPAAPSQKR